MMNAVVAAVYLSWGVWLLWEVAMGAGMLAETPWSMGTGIVLVVISAALAGMTRGMRDGEPASTLSLHVPTGEPSADATVPRPQPWTHRVIAQGATLLATAAFALWLTTDVIEGVGYELPWRFLEIAIVIGALGAVFLLIGPPGTTGVEDQVMEDLQQDVLRRPWEPDDDHPFGELPPVELTSLGKLTPASEEKHKNEG
jgi:hypothetical protein